MKPAALPVPNNAAEPLQVQSMSRTTAFGRRWTASVLACVLSFAVCHAEALGDERGGRLRPIGAGPESGLLFSSSEIGLGTLYPRHLDVVQDYVVAMTLYRLSPHEEDLKARVLVLNWMGAQGLPDAFRLVWAASNGNLVARIGKGLFRLSHGNYRANWFEDLDCRLINWSGGEIEAAVSCSDGQTDP